MSPARQSALLRVEGLRTWFPIRAGLFQRTTGHVQAVTDLDLEIMPGSTLALVGESGCGKTTAGHSILRLTPAQAGRILFDGVDLMALDEAAMRPFRRRIQIVFQDPMASLDPRMRVCDAVAEGMKSFCIEMTTITGGIIARIEVAMITGQSAMSSPLGNICFSPMTMVFIDGSVVISSGQRYWFQP